MKKYLFISILLFLADLSFAQKKVPVTNEKLSYQAEVFAPGLTRSQIVAKLNKWAVENYRNYSSTIQNTDSSALVVNGIVSVFLDYHGSHNREVAQENYNYQLLVQASENKCQLLLRNYISQAPNSPPLTTLRSRLEYIQNLEVNKKRKKILKQYASDEYAQLDKHAAQIYTTIETLLHSNKPEVVVK